MQMIARKTGCHVFRGASVFRFFAAASALLALFVLLTPGLVRAQLATADILGTVTDSTGAVVPDAKVTVRNTGTGIASSANSDKVGDFLFSHVQIGTFKVTVEAKGFKNFTVNNLELTAGQRVRVNAKLDVGSQVETVQVEASAAAELQTDSSDISAEISANEVSDMPTNGRNYYSLIGFKPGMSAGGGGGDPTDSRPSMGFTANGQSGTYNNNMIDGMDNNERSLGSVAVEPSLDALQEVKVEASNYSAEYSRTGGGIANLITKSGTNQFHGSAFEFMRNDAFDAYAWEPAGTAKTKTELRQNQFGGSLGGPILKNKAFFFGDYQGWRQINGGLIKKLVPTEAEYDSIHDYASGKSQGITFQDQWDAWGGTQPQTVVGGDITPLGLAWLMQAPKPLASCTGSYGGYSNLCGSTYNWYGAANTVQNADTYDGRIDYHFNDKNILYGRFSHNKTFTITPMSYPATTIVNGDSHTFPAMQSDNNVVDTNIALDYVHIFSPTTLFEAKASYLRPNQLSYTDGVNYWTMQKLGYPACDSDYCYNTPGVYTFPGIWFVSTPSSSPYASSAASSQLVGNYGYGGGGGLKGYIENTYQYNAALTMNRKNHSIKMGVALIRRQINAPANSGAGADFSANYAGNILMDMVEGLSDAVSITDTMIVPRRRMWEPSAYLQDDWRVTKTLTLNLGVRYDIYTPSTDRFGNFSNFDTNTDLIVSPNLLGVNNSSPTGNIKTDFHNVSPRVGFAYSFGDSNKLLRNMVLRGGFGMSYFPGNTGTTGGSFEYEMLNAPFIWSMGCGIAADATSQCEESNGYMSDADYGARPYGVPANVYVNQNPGPFNGVDYGVGGYSFKYGTPRASLDTTTATNTSRYASTMSSNIFIEPNFKSGNLEQFNLQLQKQVGNNIVTAGFVGVLGRHIPTMQNINQPISVANYNAGIYPMAGTNSWMQGVTLQQVMSGGNTAWEAGEATYERRLSYGFSANVNFTWARTEAQGTGASECVLSGCPMDNGSGVAVPVNGWKQYNYDGSTSHRASGMVSYNLPFGKSLHGVMGAAAKGWALNGTGSWATGGWSQITSGTNQSGLKTLGSSSAGGGGGGATEFPNKVPGVSVKPHNQSLANWINPDAFELQAPGMLGNGNKSSVQGPRSRDVDMGFGKTFSLLEGFKLQFRADAFNFTNTPSYAGGSGGGPGGPPGGGGPGGGGGGTYSISSYECTPTGPGPCQPSAGAKALAQGGFGDINSVGSQPRIFQFGLKLIY